MKTITITPELVRLLQAGAPVAFGVSGGKDSCAMGFAGPAYLDSIGHAGPRILVHSDLGRTEWKDSLPTCERLAKATGLELVVLRRKAGDMLDRWLVRWENNKRRYAQLECVKLILPWSTPGMRFCTSELKVDVITSWLCQRFPGQTIISASGIRRDESSKRKLAPICKRQPKLDSKTHGTCGYDWHPLLAWTGEDVFAECAGHAFTMHEAYTVYGSSRVSCCYCILARASDLEAAARCEANAEVYRLMVGLEADSTFAFQGGAGTAAKWLGDVAPHLLTSDLRDRLETAKAAAGRRERAEARIPEELEYVQGWPLRMPSWDEARMIGEVRREVAEAVGLVVEYTEADAILERYGQLMEKAKAKKPRRRALAVV